MQGRLVEMAHIVSRTLGREVLDRTAVMFRPNADGVERSGSGHVQVVCTETSPHHFACGCYDHDAGTCGPC